MPSNSKTIDPGKKAVKTFDGSADHYQQFLSDMLRECRSLGQTYVEVFQNEVVMATEDNVDDLCAEREADLTACQGPSKARDWYRPNSWVTIEGQDTYVRFVKMKVKALYMAICKGEALETAKEVEADDVGDLFEVFRSQFASVEPEQVEEKLKELEKGLMPSGNRVTIEDNVDRWAVGLETRCAAIAGLIGRTAARAEPRLSRDALVKIAMYTMPFEYKMHLETQRKEKRMMWAMCNIPAQGWNMENFTEDTREMELTWPEVKVHLSHYYKQLKMRKESKKDTPTMALEVSNGGKSKYRCASCNSPDHLAGTCPNFNKELPFCPDNIRSKLQARLKAREQKKRKNGNGDGEKKKKKKEKEDGEDNGSEQNGGWTGDWSNWGGKGGGGYGKGSWGKGGKGKGEKGKGKGAPHGGVVAAPCWQFQNTGTCWYGQNCRFSHNIPTMAVQANWSNNTGNITQNGYGVQGQPQQQHQPSSLSALMDYGGGASTTMAIEVLDATNQDKADPKSTTLVSRFLHGPNTVGFDSCSGRSVSTELGDFLRLDTSKEMLRNVAVNGVGGGGKVIGIGPMVVTLEAPECGRTVLLVDPHGVCLDGTASRLRIVSKSRLRSFGMALHGSGKSREPEMLVCERTGRKVPLVEQNGIDVLVTKSKDARNYKRNKGLLHAIDAIARFEQSPLYVNESYVIQGGDRAHSLIMQPTPLLTMCMLAKDQHRRVKEYREREEGALRREVNARSVELVSHIQSHMPALLAQCLVMNIRKLSAEQRARLFHWRFGHCAPDVPVDMTTKGLVRGVDVRHLLCESCKVCDKAKWRRSPFYRVPSEERKEYPPFWCVYIDAMGGQRSMGVQSVGGAVGNFIFVDVCSGDIKSMLYKSKDQFPYLLERYVLGVLALQYVVRVVRLDGDAVNISKKVEELAAKYEFVIQPMSAGAPEENGFAEKAVGDATRLARAFMLGAPHLPANHWGLAFAYVGYVNLLLPKRTRNARTPYEIIHHRVPHCDRMFIRVFGCSVEYEELTAPTDKMVERSASGYFVGLDPPSALIKRARDGKVMRISPKLVRTQEAMYCKVACEGGEREMLVYDDSEGEVPVAVPSIRVLKPGSLYDSTLNRGERGKECETENERNERANIEQAIHGVPGPYSRSYDAEIGRQERTQHAGALFRPLAKGNPNPREMVYLEDHEESERDVESGKLDQVRAQYTAPIQRDIFKSIVRSVKENTQGSTPPGGTGPSSGVREVRRARGEISNADSAGARVALVKRTGCQVRTEDASSGRVKRVRFAEDTKGHDRDSEACLLSGHCFVSAHGVSTSLVLTSAIYAARPPVREARVGSRVRTITQDVAAKATVLISSEAGNSTGQGTTNPIGTVVGGSSDGGGKKQVLWDGACSPMSVDSGEIRYSGNKDVGRAKRVYAPSPQFGCSTGPAGWEYEHMANAIGVSQFSEPCRTLIAIEKRAVKEGMESETVPCEHKEYPKNAFEALVSPNYRKWLDAMRKEHYGWVKLKQHKIVNKCDIEPNAVCVDIAEVYEEKRNGTFKTRSALRGDQMREGIDFDLTFAATVGADGVRLFFSLATQLGKAIKSLDVVQAYLQAFQRRPLYAFLPSYVDVIDLSDKELEKLRNELLELLNRKGKRALTQLANRKRRSSSRVLKILRSTYGDPQAGREWNLLLVEILTQRIGFKRSHVDSCVFYLTRGDCQQSGGEWCKEYILLLTFTDDLPYFGTDSIVKWFEAEIQKHLPVTFQERCTDFIGIEVNQMLDKGVTMVTQSKYWVMAAERFREYLRPPFRVRTPLPENVDLTRKPSEREIEEAKHLPYRQLLGCIAYPSCHTKLEIRFAVSCLSRYMQGWGKYQWNLALECLKYCVCHRHFGLVWLRHADSHGPNVPYGYADSSFQSPKSQGGRITMVNGAAVSASSQKHTTVDTSTTSAELTEAFLCSNDLVGFRNLLTEIGFVVEGPTVLYQDNKPVIQIVEGTRSMNATTRHFDLRVWKLKERVTNKEVRLVFCSTHDMLADIATKALGPKQFEYLRDLMTGYALLRQVRPEIDPVQIGLEAEKCWGCFVLPEA